MWAWEGIPARPPTRLEQTQSDSPVDATHKGFLLGRSFLEVKVGGGSSLTCFEAGREGKGHFGPFGSQIGEGGGGSGKRMSSSLAAGRAALTILPLQLWPRDPALCVGCFSPLRHPAGFSLELCIPESPTRLSGTPPLL